MSGDPVPIMNSIKRRTFLATISAVAGGSFFSPGLSATEKIIDIHQHTHYSGRGDADLISHQRTMGITKTVLLPAGSQHGLEADAWGNDSCLALVKKYPGKYYFFANELPDLESTRSVLEKYLKSGAIGIGEQKYFVDSDSRHIELIASIAQVFDVPVLLHFQYGKYNMNFARFHKVLEKYPKVNFIGHAQTWWGNIDRHHDQTILYPKNKVTLGGLSDRWMADYPNMFGDLSAGSGLNALMRDEEHSKAFLHRHQDKLLYGSDCNDTVGVGERCSGSQQIAMIRRLVTDSKIQRKIFYQNASRVLKIK